MFQFQPFDGLETALGAMQDAYWGKKKGRRRSDGYFKNPHLVCKKIFERFLFKCSGDVRCKIVSLSSIILAFRNCATRGCNVDAIRWPIKCVHLKREIKKSLYARVKTFRFFSGSQRVESTGKKGKLYVAFSNPGSRGNQFLSGFPGVRSGN